MSRIKKERQAIAKRQREVISPEAMSIIETLPEQQRKIVLSSMTVQHYEGPIPHPAMMKEYEEFIPGSADRIFKMTEDEQKFQHNTIKKLSNASIIQKFLGLILGVILLFYIVIMVKDLALAGHDAVAGSIGTVTIIGLATIFVLNKVPKDKK